MDDPRLELLTLKQVASRLKVGAKTVTRLVERGQLAAPRHPAGGRPCWFVGDVEVYLWRLLKGDFDGPQDDKSGQSGPDDDSSGQSGTGGGRSPTKPAKGGQAPKRPSQEGESDS